MKAVYVPIILAVLLFTPHEAAFSEGASLFNATNFVTPANEANILNTEELKFVESFRKYPNKFKYLAVMTINKSSLGGGIVTLVVPPEGQQYQVIGQAQRMDRKNDVVWLGKGQRGTSFVFSEDDHGAYGRLSAAGRIFEIFALPGKRFYVMVENVPHTMEEPMVDSVDPKTPGK